MRKSHHAHPGIKVNEYVTELGRAKWADRRSVYVGRRVLLRTLLPDDEQVPLFEAEAV